MQWLLAFLVGWATAVDGVRGAEAIAPKIQTMTLEDMAARSDVIVLARVESVDGAENATRIAKARVIEIWKGEKTDSVSFRASSTFVCNNSTAVVGEEDVLFLGASDASASRSIMHWGRGRMPLRTLDGEFFADVWSEVILPAGTPTVPGPEPRYAFIRSIELPKLKALVLKRGN